MKAARSRNRAARPRQELPPFREDLPDDDAVREFLELVREYRLGALMQPELDSDSPGMFGPTLFDDELAVGRLLPRPMGLLPLPTSTADSLPRDEVIARRVALHRQRVDGHPLMSWMRAEKPFFSLVVESFQRSAAQFPRATAAHDQFALDRLCGLIAQVLLSGFNRYPAFVEEFKSPTKGALDRSIKLIDALLRQPIYGSDIPSDRLESTDGLWLKLMAVRDELKVRAPRFRAAYGNQYLPTRVFATRSARIMKATFGYASPAVLQHLIAWRGLKEVDDQTLANYIEEAGERPHQRAR